MDNKTVVFLNGLTNASGVKLKTKKISKYDVIKQKEKRFCVDFLSPDSSCTHILPLN